MDELFCGYDVFRRRYNETDLNKLIVELSEIAKRDKIMIDRVAKLFDVSYCCPFLESDFIEYSKMVPLYQKIIDENDGLRKHFIACEAIRSSCRMWLHGNVCLPSRRVMRISPTGWTHATRTFIYHILNEKANR